MTANNTLLRSIDLLGAPLHLGSRAQLLDLARHSLTQSDRSFHFMALNPIKVIRAQREPALHEYLVHADVVYADAVGICLAAKLLYGVTQPRVPGYELHLDILHICRESGYGVYVLGGRDEVLQRALKKYHKEFADLNIVGSHHGYFSEEDFDHTILPQIRKAQPKL
ncbi:WecB/TagA/CpsF family glycosyltransferase, partial [bacterium]|nr:WecB/TagA/CpsF family glycosyltransferase [bacterium]